MLCIAVYAQQHEVTQFLGIPVDGTKTAMIQKLKAKGFKTVQGVPDALTGEFNGKDVNLFIGTNNNKVWRIIVADATGTDATNIKIRFNTLCQQFSNNSKYISVSDFSIPSSEDIQYELLVHKKRYEAAFYQKPAEDCENRTVWFMIGELYGEYQIIMFYENGYNQANGEDL